MFVLEVISVVTNIILTALFAILTFSQTAKANKAQSVITVITSYRTRRFEMQSECGANLLKNTSPLLLRYRDDKSEELKQAMHAYETLGSILHRKDEYDNELICLADEIINQTVKCIETNFNDSVAVKELEYNRERFRLLNDVYLATEWARIKKESEGSNTKTADWYDLYESIRKKYNASFKKFDEKYKDINNTDK